MEHVKLAEFCDTDMEHVKLSEFCAELGLKSVITARVYIAGAGVKPVGKIGNAFVYNRADIAKVKAWRDPRAVDRSLPGRPVENAFSIEKIAAMMVWHLIGHKREQWAGGPGIFAARLILALKRAIGASIAKLGIQPRRCRNGIFVYLWDDIQKIAKDVGYPVDYVDADCSEGYLNEDAIAMLDETQAKCLAREAANPVVKPPSPTRTPGLQYASISDMPKKSMWEIPPEAIARREADLKADAEAVKLTEARRIAAEKAKLMPPITDDDVE